MRVIISKEVQEDITEIYNYIAKDSIKYANDTANNIYFRIAQLEMTPYIGRYVPEFSHKRYREILYKSYRIVYDISESTDTIYIPFVIHSKRNFKSFFKSYIKNN